MLRAECFIASLSWFAQSMVGGRHVSEIGRLMEVGVTEQLTIPYEVTEQFVHVQTVNTRPLFLLPNGLGRRL